MQLELKYKTYKKNIYQNAEKQGNKRQLTLTEKEQKYNIFFKI